MGSETCYRTGIPGHDLDGGWRRLIELWDRRAQILRERGTQQGDLLEQALKLKRQFLDELSELQELEAEK